MTKQYNTEALSEQVVTYLSKYCKSELTSIEYYPALHSFDLYFNIESLVGPFIKRNDFKIHVQKPYMNEELYDIFTDLVKLIYSDKDDWDDDDDVIQLNFHVFAKLDLTFATLLIQMELEH